MNEIKITSQSQSLKVSMIIVSFPSIVAQTPLHYGHILKLIWNASSGIVVILKQFHSLRLAEMIVTQLGGIMNWEKGLTRRRLMTNLLRHLLEFFIPAYDMDDTSSPVLLDSLSIWFRTWLKKWIEKTNQFMLYLGVIWKERFIMNRPMPGALNGFAPNLELKTHYPNSNCHKSM